MTSNASPLFRAAFPWLLVVALMFAMVRLILDSASDRWLLTAIAVLAVALLSSKHLRRHAP